MIWLLDDWLDTIEDKDVREATQLELDEIIDEHHIFDRANSLKHVEMGHPSREIAALVHKGIFSDGYREERGLCLRTDLEAYLYEYKDLFLLIEDEEECNIYRICDNYEEAVNFLKKLEGSEVKPIEEELKEFYAKLGKDQERVDVRVNIPDFRRIFREERYEYSYTIEVDGFDFFEGLSNICDGYYNYAEGTKYAIALIDKIKAGVEKHDICIDDLETDGDGEIEFISFEKGERILELRYADFNSANEMIEEVLAYFS